MFAMINPSVLANLVPVPVSYTCGTCGKNTTTTQTFVLLPFRGTEAERKIAALIAEKSAVDLFNAQPNICSLCGATIDNSRANPTAQCTL
jgi:DNA-directed RNA polymerase subunit RPC12/RpoP